MTRTAALWSGAGILVCLWELSMYLLGTFAPGGRAAHPALSDLLDPLMDNQVLRLVFVAGWVLAGVFLLRRTVAR
jgi:hypothetical protein